jgi:hypothetical protein
VSPFQNVGTSYTADQVEVFLFRCGCGWFEWFWVFWQWSMCIRVICLITVSYLSLPYPWYHLVSHVYAKITHIPRRGTQSSEKVGDLLKVTQLENNRERALAYNLHTWSWASFTIFKGDLTVLILWMKHRNGDWLESRSKLMTKSVYNPISLAYRSIILVYIHG